MSEYPKPVSNLSDHPKFKRLPTGPGGPYDGDMEPRIARLEAHAEHAQTDLSALKVDMREVRDRLARLEEKVSHLPGKGFIVGSTAATLTLIGLLIAYQSQIQAFIAR